MPQKNPKLPLTMDERASLRKSHVKIAEIHHVALNDLMEVLDVTIERAREIKGLAAFQQVPSIGHKLAEKLVYQLGIFSFEEVRGENGADVTDQLEKKLGVWTDPCVEDQLRCVINYANYPESEKQWFDFTEERKAYRQKYGYPKSRPAKAWYEGD